MLPLPLIPFADSQAFFAREASNQNQVTSDSHPPISCRFKIERQLCTFIREGDRPVPFPGQVYTAPRIL